MADKNGVTLKRILKLFAISAKMDLAWLLRDTKYALGGMSADLISNVSTVSGVFLIASRFGGIGGMSPDEILFMMAYSTLSTGIFIMFGSGNNIHISRIIGRGQLDHLFIQPLPFKIQLLTSGFNPFTGGGNFAAGIVLLIIAVIRLEMKITFLWVTALMAFLLSTLTVIVSRSYLVSSMAFLSPAAEEISYSVIDGTWFLSTFPLSGMPALIQVPLLTILPEGLMAWFPSLCLLGKPPLGLGAYYLPAFALGAALLASYIFKKGFRYYVKKGSNRYVASGFRR